MGNKVTTSTLYDCIEQKKARETELILKEHPDWINIQMIEDSKTTPLGLASVNGDIEMIYLLINLGADINQHGHQGMTPLQWAARNGNEQAVDFLIQKGADLKKLSIDEKFSALDFAIVFIQYNIIRKFISIGSEPQALERYYQYQADNFYQYFNFEKLLDHAYRKVPKEECPSFQEEKPVKRYVDPVIDPRESWGQFFKRVSEFQEPPLVERSELPLELQPQNRGLNKIVRMFTGDNSLRQSSTLPTTANQQNQENNTKEVKKSASAVIEDRKEADDQKLEEQENHPPTKDQEREEQESPDYKLPGTPLNFVQEEEPQQHNVVNLQADAIEVNIKDQD